MTGATRGIGYELARVLARRGHDLVLVARDADALQRVRQDLSSEFGVRVEAIPVDLADRAAAENLVQQLAHQGLAVDVLVNNAGVGDAGCFAASSWEKQAVMLQLNVVTLTHLTRLVVDGMLARGHGRILNVASTAAFRPGPLMAVYSATKAYVLSFSEALAYELRNTGVTVTALCPGPTRTSFHAAAGEAGTPPERARRMASARDVAAFGYSSMMRGKTVAIHGTGNRMLAAALACLPRQVVTHLVGWARREVRTPTVQPDASRRPGDGRYAEQTARSEE